MIHEYFFAKIQVNFFYINRQSIACGLKQTSKQTAVLCLQQKTNKNLRSMMKERERERERERILFSDSRRLRDLTKLSFHGKLV